MIRIKFHSHLILKYTNALVKKCNQFAFAKEEVLLDFSNVYSIKPIAGAILFNSMKEYFTRRSKFKLTHPSNQSVHDYLDRIGLYTLNNQPRSYKTTFEITQITKHHQQKVLLYTEIIQSHVQNINNDILYSILLCMNELAQNVFEHSKSNVGCVVCGQVYTKNKEIHISVSDRGIGFRKSLQSVVGKIINDISAIEIAVEENITSRPSQVGGWGLDRITKSVVNIGGIMTYISGNGMVQYELNNKKAKKMDEPLPGVSINIILPLLQEDLTLPLFKEFS